MIFIITQGMSKYCHDQFGNVILTGLDIIAERGAEVRILQKMGFGKCILTIALPKNSSTISFEDIEISDKVSMEKTLVMNFLKLISKSIDLETAFIANGSSVDKRRGEIEILLSSIKNALYVQDKKYIMINIPTKSLAEFEKNFYGLEDSTIMYVIPKKSHVIVHYAIDEKQASETIQRLKWMGGEETFIPSIERLVN